MQSVLLVGLGGFFGSALRYGLGQIPFNGDFPAMTMMINLIGSFFIGFISELGKDRAAIGPGTLLFLRTGLCGGFTTFSAFSLETVTLLQRGRPLLGWAYAALSVAACLAGTALGGLLARAASR